MKYKILDHLLLLLLFVSPVIFLAIKNFNNSYPLNFISTFIGLIIISILILFFFKIFFKKKYLKILYFLYLFWFFQFYINATNLNFLNLSNFSQKIIILIIIIIISFLLSFFLNEYIKNFIIIFIFLNLIYLLTDLLLPKNFERNTNLNSSEIIDLKFKNKENIYFIILDQMTSKKLYLEKYALDISINLNNFQKKGYRYIDNTKTDNLESTKVISSIFNLNKDVSSKERNLFLGENSKSHELLFLLKNNDYKVWYLDNDMVKCPAHELINCINKGSSSLINSPIYHLFSVSIFNKVYKYLIHEYFVSFKKDKLYQQTEIDKFLIFFKNNQKLIINKKNFIFIHNLGPHHPYRDKNCRLISFDYKMSDDEINDYKSSTLCVLKKVEKFVSYIEKYDNDATIVIQGDHGFSTDNNIKKRDKDIFNLVKIPNNCNFSLKPISNNINIFKNILNCI